MAGAAIVVFVLLICVVWDICCVIVCDPIKHTCQTGRTNTRTAPRQQREAEKAAEDGAAALQEGPVD